MFKNITEVNEWSKRTFKKPLSYKVFAVWGKTPNQNVIIAITLGNGSVHRAEGSSKKNAALEWAKQFNPSKK